MPAQFEYSPEISEDFYKRLIGGIGEQEAQGVGQARSEALSRGLTGDPFEASAVGGVRQGAARARSDTAADLAYSLAGMKRQERMTGEERTYQSGEAEKSRSFQERMARLYNDWQGDRENTANRRQMQSSLVNAGVGLASRGIGAAAGKYF